MFPARRAYDDALHQMEEYRSRKLCARRTRRTRYTDDIEPAEATTCDRSWASSSQRRATARKSVILVPNSEQAIRRGARPVFDPRFLMMLRAVLIVLLEAPDRIFEATTGVLPVLVPAFERAGPASMRRCNEGCGRLLRVPKNAAPRRPPHGAPEQRPTHKAACDFRAEIQKSTATEIPALRSNAFRCDARAMQRLICEMKDLSYGVVVANAALS